MDLVGTRLRQRACAHGGEETAGHLVLSKEITLPLRSNQILFENEGALNVILRNVQRVYYKIFLLVRPPPQLLKKKKKKKLTARPKGISVKGSPVDVKQS